MTVSLILFLTPFFIYGGYRGYFNYSGYCFDERRYLSDAEKINLAVRGVMGTYLSGIQYEEKVNARREAANNSKKHYIPYRNIEEFFSLNPNCCKVTKEFHDRDGEVKVGFFDRITGSISDYVVVKYFSRYLDDQGIEQKNLITTYPAISSCGNMKIAF